VIIDHHSHSCVESQCGFRYAGNIFGQARGPVLTNCPSSNNGSGELEDTDLNLLIISQNVHLIMFSGTGVLC